MEKTVKIAVTNQKGGLGKTTVSVFLSRCLADDQGKKILFLDLDVQGNSSYTLEQFNTHVKASDFLSRDLNASEIKSIKHCEGGISLLCASPELANDDGFNPKNALDHFSANFDKLNDFFDMVVVDTPPTLGNKLIISLLICDHALIPLEMDSFALQGLGRLLATITSFKQANHEINILGLIVNKFQRNRKRQLNVLQLLQQSSDLGKLLFETKIRFRDCITDALSEKIALTDLRKRRGYSSSSFTSAINDFRSFTYEVLDRIR